MARVRGFSIVFHNVRDDCKSSVEKFIKAENPSQYLVALEPYPESEGHHVHLFVSFKNPRQFKVMLNKCIEFSNSIMTEKPPDTITDWGRVQVDTMRGSFKQATKYLTNPDKDKICDENVVKKKKGDIMCDVCGTIGPWVDMACDYPDGETGRCRGCFCVPHRMLMMLGHKVRDLTSLKNKIL